MKGQTQEDLIFLLAYDTDAFCRWEAGQRLLRDLLTSLYTAATESKACIHVFLWLPARSEMRCAVRRGGRCAVQLEAAVSGVGGSGIVAALQEATLEDKLAGAGGVPDALVSAIGAVLSNKDLDGAFAAAAISLPAAAELIGTIPNIDPVLLHDIRSFPFSTQPV